MESNDESSARFRRYYLTLIKAFSHATQPSAIKGNVEQLIALRELYSEVQPVIKELDLTREGIRYFATYVLKSPTWRLAAKEQNDKYLHIITFVAHQYYQLQDILVDVFLSSVTAINNTARREHKERCYEQRSQKNSSLANIIKTVEELLSGYAEIHDISHKQGLLAERKIELIKKLLEENESTISGARKHVSNLKTSQASNEADFYAILESKSLKLQNRVAGIIKALDLDLIAPTMLFMAPYATIESKPELSLESAPCDFLSPFEQSVLRADSAKFRGPLYKVLLFGKIAEAIRAGTLNLEHSYKYRTLEDYLIARSAWDDGKNTLIERAGLQDARNCPKALTELQSRLEQYYQLTNGRIIDGSNEFVLVKSDGAYTVQTPPLTEKSLPDYLNTFQRQNLSPCLKSSPRLTRLQISSLSLSARS